MPLPNRVVLVKNEADLTRLIALRPEVLRQAQPLAASAEATLLLRARGLSSVSLPELLTDESVAQIYREARRLSGEWYLPIAHELECGGVNLGALLANDLFDFFLHATAAEAAIRALIRKRGRAEFCLMPPAGIPCVWESAYNCRHNLIEAAIQDAAARDEAEVSVVRPHPVWHAARLGRAMARRLGGVRQRAGGPRRLHTNGRRVPLSWDRRALQRQPGERLALAVGNSLSLRTVFGYAPLLERIPGYHVLGASFDDAVTEIADRTGLVVDRPYFRLKDLPSGVPMPAVQSAITRAQRRFAELRLQSPEPAISNPFLAFQFDHVFTDLLPAVLRAYSSSSEAIKMLEPELVLVAAHGFVEQAAVAAARQCGTPSVMMTHGVLSWLHPVSTDHYWAWGELPKRILLDEFRWDANRVRVVGAPQFLHVAEMTSATRLDQRAAVRHRLGVHAGASLVLVLTGGLADGPWQAAASSRFSQSWDELLEWARQRPDVVLVIRPHPLVADLDAWYDAVLNAPRLHNVVLAREGAVEEIAAAADLAIVMQHVTTAGLVALHAGCQLVYVRSARRFDTRAEAVWSEANGVTVVNATGELGDLLDRLFGDSATRRACLDRGRQFMARYVAESDRLAEQVSQAVGDALELNRARFLA